MLLHDCRESKDAAKDTSLPINNQTTMARAHASIHELRTAVTISRSEQLHADVTGYCSALLGCEVIDDIQWQVLIDLANATLDKRTKAPDMLDKAPRWPCRKR